MPARPRGLLEPCAATSGQHGSEEGDAGKRRPLSDNTAHHTRDVTFAEDANRTRTRNTPAVLAVLRDIVHSAFRLAGWANTASARRAHTTPASTFSLYGIP